MESHSNEYGPGEDVGRPQSLVESNTKLSVRLLSFQDGIQIEVRKYIFILEKTEKVTSTSTDDNSVGGTTHRIRDSKDSGGTLIPPPSLLLLTSTPFWGLNDLFY